MPFSVTQPEPYVLFQVFPFQAANNLLDNDRAIEDSIEAEHTNPGGLHSTARVANCIGLFSWDASSVAEVYGYNTHASTPITRNGAGDFTIQFNFSFSVLKFFPLIGSSGNAEAGDATDFELAPLIRNWAYNGTNLDRIDLNFWNDAGVAKDPRYISLAVFGSY